MLSVPPLRCLKTESITSPACEMGRLSSALPRREPFVTSKSPITGSNSGSRFAFRRMRQFGNTCCCLVGFRLLPERNSPVFEKQKAVSAPPLGQQSRRRYAQVATTTRVVCVLVRFRLLAAFTIRESSSALFNRGGRHCSNSADVLLVLNGTMKPFLPKPLIAF